LQLKEINKEKRESPILEDVDIFDYVARDDEDIIWPKKKISEVLGYISFGLVKISMPVTLWRQDPDEYDDDWSKYPAELLETGYNRRFGKNFPKPVKADGSLRALDELADIVLDHTMTEEHPRRTANNLSVYTVFLSRLRHPITNDKFIPSDCMEPLRYDDNTKEWYADTPTARRGRQTIGAEYLAREWNDFCDRYAISWGTRFNNQTISEFGQRGYVFPNPVPPATAGAPYIQNSISAQILNNIFVSVYY